MGASAFLEQLRWENKAKRNQQDDGKARKRKEEQWGGELPNKQMNDRSCMLTTEKTGVNQALVVNAQSQTKCACG